MATFGSATIAIAASVRILCWIRYRIKRSSSPAKEQPRCRARNVRRVAAESQLTTERRALGYYSRLSPTDLEKAHVSGLEFCSDTGRVAVSASKTMI